MQMVAFAKDPKGENIFAKSTNFSADSTDGTNTGIGRRSTLATIDSQKSLKVNTENGESIDKQKSLNGNTENGEGIALEAH